MADFIAVIRRAVDGLSDNTPEMRVKVYERARSAVQRQLDNMKPRPADDVIARQLDKLDDAIATIEREFSGAPPVADEPELPEEPVDVEPDAPPAEPVREPEPEPSPEPEPAAEIVADAPVEQAKPETRVEPAVEAPAWMRREPEPATDEVPPPAEEEPAAVETEEDIRQDDDTMPPPVETKADDWQEHRFEEPLVGRSARKAEPREWDIAEPEKPAKAEPEPEAPQPAWTPEVADNPFHEPEEIFSPANEPKAPVEPSREPDFLRADLRPNEPSRAKAKDDEEWWKEPAAEPLRPETRAGEAAAWDSFEAFVGDRSTPLPDAPVAERSAPRARDGMALGRQEPERAAPAAKPKREDREGRGRIIIAILAALIVLAGAGYAGWRFSDNILAFVNGLSSSGTQTASKPASSTPTTPASTPATTPATAPANQQASAPATAPAATGPQKFTQRLMPDGSEVDTGTQGETVAAAGQTEGKSVAAQNVKPAAQPTPSTPASTPATTPPAEAAQATPVKMYLYEERLGQASPTALDGTVTWSVKTDEADGHKEKMIEGDINVPSRKMSAIMTIRRNTDASLPASHIIELTFSLPKDFEGRGIESVLRISMKDREQDQGDPLIAVPAKITDYFHMIALNAYADAVKTNLDLLKNREWIDIPLTYSNGRRALITLQKGEPGDKVFNDVIASWQSTGTDIPIPTPSPEPPAPTPAPAQ